jgi:polysaccharide deacetylase 2 family uncharacterized protein YibQ
LPKPLSGFLLIGVAILLQLGPTPSKSDPLETTAYVSIIIDDIGYNHDRGEAVITLPASLTYAVIPDADHAMSLAHLANRNGKEVMLHLPMENLGDRPLGNIALTRDLNRHEFGEIIDTALQQVPFARGINNHMGSALTQEPEAMHWLMQSVKRHQLFFIDSRTTHMTVASEIAEQQNVLSASRDIFLDNERNIFAIDQQFRKLIRLARQKRTAIAIGHPYPATTEYLAYALPLLADENIRVIPVSDMLKMRLARQQVARNL